MVKIVDNVLFLFYFIFRIVSMAGTIVTLLLLVVAVAPQERQSNNDLDQPKRPPMGGLGGWNPGQWESNMIIHEA